MQRDEWFRAVWLQTKQLPKNTFSATTRLFLRQPCPICDRPTHQTFCTDCDHQIQDNCRATVHQTQHTTTTTGISIHTLGTYLGTLMQALSALKYNNRSDIAKTLGTALGLRWPAHYKQLLERAAQTKNKSSSRTVRPYVIPIPLHPNRKAQRGYNQAELIGKAYCQASGLPLLAHGLCRVQDTLPQHQLGRVSRQDNLRHAFHAGSQLQTLCRRKAAPIEILLIDDIYTTGATMQTAAAALKGLPVTVVGILSIARAVQHT